MKTLLFFVTNTFVHYTFWTVKIFPWASVVFKQFHCDWMKGKNTLDWFHQRVHKGSKFRRTISSKPSKYNIIKIQHVEMISWIHLVLFTFSVFIFVCLLVCLFSCLCASECQLVTIKYLSVCLFVSLWWWSCWMHLGAMLLNISHPSLYCPTKLIPLCPTLLSNQTSNFECHSLHYDHPRLRCHFNHL